MTDNKQGTALENISYGFSYTNYKKWKPKICKPVTRLFYAAGIVSWVSQCSFEPPMVIVAIKNDSDLNETVQKNPALCPKHPG